MQGQGGGLKLGETLQLVAAGGTSSWHIHEMTSLQSKALHRDKISDPVHQFVMEILAEPTSSLPRESILD